jgi:hypothetical protein
MRSNSQNSSRLNHSRTEFRQVGTHRMIIKLDGTVIRKTTLFVSFWWIKMMDIEVYISVQSKKQKR